MSRTPAGIRFALSRAGHDRILVAATERGISWADVDGNERSLLDRFRAWSASRHPGAGTVKPAAVEVEPGVDARLDAALRVMRAALSGDGAGGRTPAGPGDIALDERGTELQLSVWRALRAIPAGKTASYSEIARSIGKPAAARAVANACAANRIAIITPCHRAVRSDGGLGGFRWGIARKRKLLELEGGL